MKKIVLVTALTLACVNAGWAIHIPEPLVRGGLVYCPDVSPAVENYFREVTRNPKLELVSFKQAEALGATEAIRTGHTALECMYWFMVHGEGDYSVIRYTNSLGKIEVVGPHWIHSYINDKEGSWWTCDMDHKRPAERANRNCPVMIHP